MALELRSNECAHRIPDPRIWAFRVIYEYVLSCTGFWCDSGWNAIHDVDRVQMQERFTLLLLPIRSIAGTVFMLDFIALIGEYFGY
jgi:hypothetical protein